MVLREKPSPALPTYKLECVCCSQIQYNRVHTKFRICEASRAQDLLDAANFLMDDVFTRISDLKTVQHIFGADLHYHNTCFNDYIRKYKMARNKDGDSPVQETSSKRKYFAKYVDLIRNIIRSGRGITISDMRYHQ